MKIFLLLLFRNIELPNDEKNTDSRNKPSPCWFPG